MLNSSYCNKLPSLRRRGANLSTFLVQKGPALYFITIILAVFQVLTCPAQSAMQNLTMVRVVLGTIEAAEEVISFLNKLRC